MACILVWKWDVNGQWMPWTKSSDEEEVWVRYDSPSGIVTDLWTYWHGTILHAGSGMGGFLSHTNVMGYTFLINGEPMSETELQGCRFGEQNIPLIFASGDDVLGAALHRTMPATEHVQVKRTATVSRAILSDAAAGRAALRDGARRAVERMGSIKPVRLGPTFRVGFRALLASR
jgi:D-aminopeptidase